MITRNQKTYLNKMNSVAVKTQLGTLLRQRKGVLKGVYDVANVLQGGAVGTIDLLDEDGNKVKLPSGAIVEKCLVHIVTAFVSAGGAGTVAFRLQSAGDLVAAVDADTLSGVVAGVPDGAAANCIVMTAERTLQAVVATEALTAGKAHVFVEYLLSTESSDL